MLRTLKSDQRLIETLRLPVSLLPTPITGMRSEAVNKLVPPPILCRLVSVTGSWPNPGSAQQGQAKCFIVRLVRAVLAVGKDRHTKTSALVREVEPLVRWHFKLSLVVVA